MKLMAAAFIVRILGFANRIYMSNILGAEGMGLFQLAAPVYSLIILTLTSGVSISVSGMTAQGKSKGKECKRTESCKDRVRDFTGLWRHLRGVPCCFRENDRCRAAS